MTIQDRIEYLEKIKREITCLSKREYEWTFFFCVHSNINYYNFHEFCILEALKDVGGKPSDDESGAFLDDIKNGRSYNQFKLDICDRAIELLKQKI